MERIFRKQKDIYGKQGEGKGMISTMYSGVEIGEGTQYKKMFEDTCKYVF